MSENDKQPGEPTTEERIKRTIEEIEAILKKRGMAQVLVLADSGSASRIEGGGWMIPAPRYELQIVPSEGN
ncbi:MAG: hypothetical protein DRH30_00945 [Deltaproteobacteria bacterium]|nr:MAG: hypothetical protein DRH30_00945 [Deltaproteobacteria bacterium]